MYTLYTDQSELFEATISITGASLTDTKCRLVIESDVVNLMFTGKIDSDGACSIPIKALAKYFPEGKQGTMRLEVIAENTYFVPWESEYTVKTHKKVTVEVKSRSEIPTIVEAKATIKPPPSHEENISNLIIKSYSKKKNPSRFTNLMMEIKQYITDNKLTESQFEPILDKAIKLLTEKV